MTTEQQRSMTMADAMAVIENMDGFELLTTWQTVRDACRAPNTTCGESDALGETADDMMDEIQERSSILTPLSSTGEFVRYRDWTWLLTARQRTPFDNGSNLYLRRVHDNHVTCVTFWDDGREQYA